MNEIWGCFFKEEASDKIYKKDNSATVHISKKWDDKDLPLRRKLSRPPGLLSRFSCYLLQSSYTFNVVIIHLDKWFHLFHAAQLYLLRCLWTNCSFSPKAGCKTLMRVFLLYLEERCTLSSEGEQMLKRIWTNRPCWVSPSSLPLAHSILSYHIFPWLPLFIKFRV